MSKYYALKAGSDGVTVHSIKDVTSVEEAETKAKASLLGPEDKLLTVMDTECYTCLRRSIMTERMGSVPGGNTTGWDMGSPEEDVPKPVVKTDDRAARSRANAQPVQKDNRTARIVKTQGAPKENRPPKE